MQDATKQERTSYKSKGSTFGRLQQFYAPSWAAIPPIPRPWAESPKISQPPPLKRENEDRWSFLGVVLGPSTPTDGIDGDRGNVRLAKLPGCTRERIMQLDGPFNFRGRGS